MDTPFSLPTPPTLEQRLDAAAEEWRRLSYLIIGRGGEAPWAKLNPQTRRMYLDQVETVCRAFAPEHFKDADTTTGKD